MNLIVALVIASLVYIVQKRLYAKWWNRNLDVTISFEDTCVREGDASALTEVIYNGKFLPLPVFHVKFSTDRSFRFADTENTVVTDSYYRNDVFSVLGYRKITRRLPFQTGKRGLYGIPSLNMTARDFFMTTNFAYSRKSDAWLYVLPKRVASPELSMFCSHLLGELETRRNQMEDPYTFRGIREYTYGDTYGKINWKATAKASKLMVNMYGYTSEQRVRILLNLETNIMVKTEYLQEMSIRMAGTIAEYFLQHKVSVELVSNGIDCMTGACERVEAGMSMEHGETIDKYLSVTVDNPTLCTRYSARVVKNVKIAPSPLWLRMRLRASGVRPINNIVDITNYVMLEYGQPMHAFDYKCLDGSHIIVRNAGENEEFLRHCAR